ncbi:MAG: MATE family efflux transporter [Oscillospiraceae bacterium]|nr:MATE family efflux transporter [Oscillospiraceae bacterium]
MFEIDTTNGPVLKKMLLFAVPLMFSSVLQLLFNAADIVVIGRFAGDNSLAAVGSTGSLINLMTNMFIGLSVGASVLVSRYFGSKNSRAVHKTVHTAMLLSVISGLLLTVVGVTCAESILRLMKSPPEVLPLATTYMKVYFFGITPMLIYNFGASILRAVGDTKRPLFYLMLSGAVNVLFNLLFVIVFKMDVAGVALATAISQCLAAYLVVRCLMNETSSIKLELRKLHIYPDVLAGILRIGLPAGFQGVVFALSNVVIQSSVNLFGKTVIAGNSAAQNIEGFVYVSMNAFHQAAVTFVSQNYGAGKVKRINKITITALVCVSVAGTFLGLLAYIFGESLLSIYSDSQEVIAAGMNRLSVIVVTYALCGIMDVMVGALRGIGYSVMPMIVSMIGACGLRLLWIATVFQIDEFHTTEVVYLSYPISWIITFLTHVVCYIIVKRKVDRKYIRSVSCDPELT